MVGGQFASSTLEKFLSIPNRSHYIFTGFMFLHPFKLKNMGSNLVT